MLAHSLDRFCAVTKFILPTVEDLKFSTLDFVDKCESSSSSSSSSSLSSSSSSSSGFFASLLLEEPLSAYCPAMSIFGNMAPVWTYSLFKVILPTSLWMTLGCLWSHGNHSVMHLVYLLSFSNETCPAHQCLLVQIWWITSMTPVSKWIQLTLLLSCSVSPIIFHSMLHCVVTIFCSCLLLRDHVLLPYVITWSMHLLFTMHFHFQPQWYAFVSHNGVQLAKSSPTKAYSTSQLLFLIMILCHHLTEGEVVVNFFYLPSIDVNICFVNSRIAHDLCLSQVHIETCWFASFMDVLYHLLQY